MTIVLYALTAPCAAARRTPPDACVTGARPFTFHAQRSFG